MRDDDDGIFFLQFQGQVFDFLRRNRVQRRRRFVHEDDRRTGCQSPGNAEALLLAAGEAEGTFLEAVLHFIPAGRLTKALFDDGVELRLILDALDARTVSDIFIDALRERRRLLEDHADTVAQGQGVDFLEDILAFKADIARDPAAFDPVIHTVQGLEERRFAAARRTDESRDFILLDFHVDVFQGLEIIIKEIHMADIEKTGPGKVVAGDITGSSAVEIMNPDQIICTVTGDTTFQAELTVEWGKGYQPAEKQEKENLAVGQIPIDAIFTPVRKIQYVVSQARVGHQTDYDKLTLEIETDGSVRPENALAYAAKILKDQLTIFINFDEDRAEPDINVIAGPPVPLNPYLDKPVEDLELSVRSANCLKNAEINFIGDLAQKTDQEMLKTKNFGRKSLNEIKALLAEMDLTLGMKFESWSPPPVREKTEDQGQ